MLSDIALGIGDFFGLDRKLKYFMGQGTIAHSSWIGIDDTENLLMTIIFYPLENGLTINICQKTKKLKLKKFGRKNIIENRMVLKEYLKIKLTDFNWVNSYPKVMESKTWDRANSYAKSSPISIFMTFDKSNFEEFVSNFFSIQKYFYFMKNDMDIVLADPANYKKSLILNLENYKKHIDLISDYYNYSFCENGNIDNIQNEFENNRITSAKRNIDRSKHQDIINKKAENGKKAEIHVFKFEKAELIKANKMDLAEKVNILSTDGDGYDILSYYADGSPKKIEVKSSSNDRNNTIYISQREWDLFENKESLIYYVTENGNDVKIIKFEHPNFRRENLIPNFYKIKF